MQLPTPLIRSLTQAPGFEEEAFKKAHVDLVPVTTVRINPRKIAAGSIQGLFGDNLGQQVAWCENGYYLKHRPSFTLDPLFHAGAYYVQEASSMFLEEVLKQVVDLDLPLKVLDLCAAPGGKSTLIQSVISGESMLVSNEIIKMRVNILAENLTKWGTENVIVTNNDPRDFKRLPGYFDLVIVDAPCSGSGLFRKDPGAIEEWSEQNVQLCSQRQQRILADILPSLKEGGVLVYSTCSYSMEEDEAIADWLVQEGKLASIRLNIQEEWGIVESCSPLYNANGYRFYPDKVKGEGFYIAVFKKETAAGEVSTPATNGSRKKPALLTAAEIANLQPFVKNPIAYFYIRQNEEVIAVPKHLEKDLSQMQSALYIKKAGVKLGQLIRNELVPGHEMALSTLASEGISTMPVDKETALQYLRKQDISRGASANGWTLITFRQIPLGWVKVLPNRVNNYYPKDWRILNK